MNTNDWAQLLQQMSILNSSVAGCYSKVILGVAALKILAAIVCLLMGAIFFLCYRSGRKAGLVVLLLWPVCSEARTLRFGNHTASSITVTIKHADTEGGTYTSWTAQTIGAGQYGAQLDTGSYTWWVKGSITGCDMISPPSNPNGTITWFETGCAVLSYTNWVSAEFTFTNTYGRIINYEIVGWTNGVPFATNTVFLVPGASYTVPSLTNGAPFSLVVESTLDWESPLTSVANITATPQTGDTQLPGPSTIPSGVRASQDPLAVSGGQPSSWNIPTNAAIADRQNANAIVQAVAAGASQNAFLLSNVISAVSGQPGNWLTGMVSVTGTNTNGIGGTTLGQGLTNYAARPGGGWSARAAPSIVVPLSQFDPGIGLEDYTWNWNRTDENGVDQGEWDSWITTMRAVVLVLETIAAGYGCMRAVMWAVS